MGEKTRPVRPLVNPFPLLALYKWVEEHVRDGADTLSGTHGIHSLVHQKCNSTARFGRKSALGFSGSLTEAKLIQRRS